MRISLVPAQWPGDELADVLRAARWGVEAGVHGLWLSEVAGFDSVGLAVAVAPLAGDAEVLVGPVSPIVRDPALFAMGLATVAAIAQSRVLAVLGTSSPTIVADWHGRPWEPPLQVMASAVSTLRAAAGGGRTDHAGPGIASRGFRLRVTPLPGLQVVVAAQGPLMLRLAGALADRVVVNLVTPDQASAMVGEVASGARSAGRPAPPVAAWLVAGSRDASRSRVARLLEGYVQAPGYRERFQQAGFVIDGHMRPDAVDELAVFGDASAVVGRAAAYAAAGVSEVALVVSGRDPEGRAIVTGTAAAAGGEKDHG
jgi:probable F420-dependent oxidoreductase